MATPGAAQPARLAQLAQLSCKIFQNVYNPTAARTGNKVLRQRLVGPTMTAYNPQKLVHFRDIKALYPALNLVDMEEKARLDEIARRKRRGKGAPKKGKLLIQTSMINWFIHHSFLYSRSGQACFSQEKVEDCTVITIIQIQCNMYISHFMI